MGRAKKRYSRKRVIHKSRPRLFSDYKKYYMASTIAPSRVPSDLSPRPYKYKKISSYLADFKRRSSKKIKKNVNQNIKRSYSRYHRDFMDFKLNVCKSRSTRREVLFSKRKTGKGSKSKKNWTAKSYINCK